MSRPSSIAGSLAGSRNNNLTLTEELEKLEQSITLTLQEIDHNFSRAHRIVTSSILPVVEQYSRHSEAIWEGSRFWKQFFEASANVSLSGYEEQEEAESGPDREEESTMLEGDSIDQSADTTVTTSTVTGNSQDEIGGEDPSVASTDDSTMRSSTPPGLPTSRKYEDDDGSLLISSPSMANAHSTPRMPEKSAGNFSNYSSPYEKLKAEMRAAQRNAEDADDTTTTTADDDDDFDIDIDTTELSDEPATPRAAQPHPAKALLASRPGAAPSDLQDSPNSSSPFGALPTDRTTYSSASSSRHQHNKTPASNDPLLHRVLDKTYRIAATPHSTRQQPLGPSSAMRRRAQAVAASKSATPSPARKIHRARWQLDFSSSPASSPEVAAPQLRAEIFNSPLKQHQRHVLQGTRTPGVSVQTPGRSGDAASSANFEQESARKGGTRHLWDDGLDDSDGDLEDQLGFSPPKTIQFHVPASRLLQTPAREAAKGIVENILMTAGGDVTDDDDRTDLDSPSVVRRHEELDETF